MITLRSSQLIARIDPQHGGEILDFVERASGRQVLGRPPFAATAPVAGDLDESTWLAGYRGGWQMLTPNAGNGCIVAGARHGFHGAASHASWAVCATDTRLVTMRWRSHGLQVERRIALDADALVITVAMTATDERVPFIVVEHLALGHALFDPDGVIELPGGRGFEMSETDGPAHPPADATYGPTFACWMEQLSATTTGRWSARAAACSAWPIFRRGR